MVRRPDSSGHRTTTRRVPPAAAARRRAILALSVRSRQLRPGRLRTRPLLLTPPPQAVFVNNLVASRILDTESRSLRNSLYRVHRAEGHVDTEITEADYLGSVRCDDFGLNVTNDKARRLFAGLLARRARWSSSWVLSPKSRTTSPASLRACAVAADGAHPTTTGTGHQDPPTAGPVSSPSFAPRPPRSPTASHRAGRKPPRSSTATLPRGLRLQTDSEVISCDTDDLME